MFVSFRIVLRFLNIIKQKYYVYKKLHNVFLYKEWAQKYRMLHLKYIFIFITVSLLLTLILLLFKRLEYWRILVLKISIPLDHSPFRNVCIFYLFKITSKSYICNIIIWILKTKYLNFIWSWKPIIFGITLP